MKKAMKKSGFTLVEIMIVVAIIGLLAAIGIPSFQKARNKSIEKAKANNVRIVESAVGQWAIDNGKADGAAVSAADIASYIKGAATDGSDLTTTDGPLNVGGAAITLPSTVTGTASY